MPHDLRITDNVVAIFNLMVERPRKAWFGLELAQEAEIGSATIYAALTRMERAGLLDAHWETPPATELGRPRRRLYSLTAEGIRVGRQAIADYRPRVVIDRNRTGWLPGPQTAEVTR